MKTILTALALVLTLAGCASNQYPVTFTSDPTNAAVTCNKQMMGYTPLTLYYEREQIKGDTLRLNCVVTWISGARENFENFEVPLSQYPKGVVAWASRENKYPNYHLDAQAAMYGTQQRENAQQRQNQQNQQEMLNMQQQLGNIGRSTSTNCYKVGNQVFCNSY